MEEKFTGPLLQGTEDFPNSLSVNKLLQTRAKEIENLQNYLIQQTGTKLIFQRLPQHMRRRTMSHNVKRLPRKLREAQLNQMKKSGISPQQKRPSRKFRRRPKNLLENYNQRQRDVTWLETHIWHAKRFHMIFRWGYKLPDMPCDKSFRACYRASVKHCLLQDISYFNLIEISGPEDTLIGTFRTVTSPNTGLTLAARAFKNGAREGEIMFYHKNEYPCGAIGFVKFMWKPELPTDDNLNKTIWLWAHAAYYSEVLNLLINIFNLKLIQTFAGSEPTYISSSLHAHVTIKDYKDCLNRFRLTGPLAHSVLKKALNIAPKTNLTEWFQTYLDHPKHKTILNEHHNFWNSLQNINSQSELSPHLIFNMIITDPRYNFPLKRTKALPSTADFTEIANIPEDIKFGPIWDYFLRKKSSSSKLSPSEFILQQKKKLVPDAKIPVNAAVVPIMLIQQPGNKNDHLGYGSGWDIVFPKNWGGPLWLSFIMWGARAGGLRESNLLRFEQGIPDFLQPDTKAGGIEEKRISTTSTDKFFKLPPNKRVNYNKLGVVSPFNSPWLKLISEWSNSSVDSFFILRDKKMLINLQKLLENKQVKNFVIDYKIPCIVPVKLNLIKRGRIKKFSMICIADETYIKSNREPIEPIHVDLHQNERKSLRSEHQKLLKRLKRKRSAADKETTPDENATSELIAKHSKEMKSLWLPEAKGIKNSCSKEIFGFVSRGDFSFSAAKGQCLGYIVLSSLPTYFSLNTKTRNIVFLRDTCSRQYRLAKMEIICN